MGRHAGVVGGGLAGGSLQNMLGPCVAGKAREGVSESSCALSLLQSRSVIPKVNAQF